jgi:short-subunit dehydrogenase
MLTIRIFGETNCIIRNLRLSVLTDFESAININYLSQVYACKELLPQISDLGAIVNISSASALCPFGSVSAYTASKAASFAFSTALCCELKNISVSSVAPGFVKTDIMKNQAMSEKEARLVGKFSADPNKVARKILHRVKKRKGRITVGFDAHLMSIAYRLFPRLAPRIISAFLKKSGLNMFNI